MRISLFAKRVFFQVDPIAVEVDSGQRYTPIGLTNIKVTRPFIKQVIATRRLERPFQFIPGSRLGVVIPFRDRHEHLKVLLPVLEARLKAQRIDYRIAVVEQEPGISFNPGKVRNVGAALLADWCDYYCFHDVDNIPVNANYTAANYPLRLISSWSETERSFDVFDNYTYFSGAVTFPKNHFYSINGYPNNYCGWGHEDEVLYYRLILNGFVGYQDNEGIYEDLANPHWEAEHRASQVQKSNKRKMISQIRWNRLGKSGMSDLKYRLLSEKRLDERVSKYTVSV